MPSVDSPDVSNARNVCVLSLLLQLVPLLKAKTALCGAQPQVHFDDVNPLHNYIFWQKKESYLLQCNEMCKATIYMWAIKICYCIPGDRQDVTTRWCFKITTW